MSRYIVGKGTIDVFVFVDIQDKTIMRVVADDESFDDTNMEMAYTDEDGVVLINGGTVDVEDIDEFDQILITQHWPSWNFGF